MTRWFVDTDYPSREWKTIDKHLKPARLEGDTLRADGAPLSEGVLLVHRRCLGLKQAWKDIQGIGPGVVVVVVSGAAQSEGEVVPGHVYFRQAPVDIPTDPVFTRCWQRFLVRSASGVVDFALLEPSLPDLLRALRMLALLVDTARGGPLSPTYRTKEWWAQGAGARDFEDLAGSLVDELGPTMGARVKGALEASVGELPNGIDRLAKFLQGVGESHLGLDT